MFIKYFEISNIFWRLYFLKFEFPKKYFSTSCWRFKKLTNFNKRKLILFKIPKWTNTLIIEKLYFLVIFILLKSGNPKLGQPEKISTLAHLSCRTMKNNTMRNSSQFLKSMPWNFFLNKTKWREMIERHQKNLDENSTMRI